jgi:hypothetical protein
MLTRFAGIAVICSSLLAGCVTTTTTQTCLPGGVCSDPQTTTSSWPDSSPTQPQSHEDTDYTGAIVTATALATAVALTAFFVAHRHDDDHEKSAPHATVTDADMRLERMYAQAHLSARAGRCDAVVAIGKKLAREQPAEYERYAADRELAVCLPSPVVSIR